MRPTAGKAALRPAQNSSRSASELELRSVVARLASASSDTLRDQVIDLDLRTVELDDQDRLDVDGVAGMDEFLDRMDGRPVHHLDAGRNDAGADDAADAGPGVPGVGEADQHGARAFRLLEDADRHLGDDAEQPFGTDEQAEQVVSSGIEMLAAEPDDVAIDQHDLAAQHVVGGQPVFEAVHAARVLRDIAADGAGDLRGRVGGVVEAAVGDGLGDREIGDARVPRPRPGWRNRPRGCG